MSVAGDHVGTPIVNPTAIHDWVVNAAPQRRWPPLRLGQLWSNRELLYFFASRDLKVRYKQAFLGVAWAGIQPLVGAVTFTVLFHQLADVQVEAPSYFAFALLGSGVWAYYSSALQTGTSSLLHNADLLTKVAFPRIVAPTATFLPPLIDLAVATTLAAAIAVVTGASFSPAGVLVGLPAGLVLLVVAVAGPVFYLCAAVVKYRDVATLLGFAVQLLLFVSPIAFPPELVPAEWRIVLYVNPLAGALGLLRWALVGTSAPTGAEVMLSFLVAGSLLLVGLMHFRRSEREFADII